jgi:hypothetical protein
MPELEGRIPGFNDRWNKRYCYVCQKEDKLRWKALDRQMEIQAQTGSQRPKPNLGRSHSCIGPFPGCRRNVELSPRKSASVCFLEQKLLGGSHEDPERPRTREHLYEGVSQQGQGKKNYLKQRVEKYSVHQRFGEIEPGTTNQAFGFKKPVFSGPNGEYVASKYCHKPGVTESFFRPNGAKTHLDPPVSRKD